MTVTTVSPRQLAELLAGGTKIDLIDVRTPVEFREVHFESARNVPLGRIAALRPGGKRRLTETYLDDPAIREFMRG